MSEPRKKKLKREPRRSRKFWANVDLCPQRLRTEIYASFDELKNSISQVSPEWPGAYEAWKQTYWDRVNAGISQQQSRERPSHEELVRKQLELIARKVPLDRVSDERTICQWVLTHLGCRPKEIDVEKTPCRAAVNILLIAEDDSMVRRQLVTKLLNSGGKSADEEEPPETDGIDMLELLEQK